MVVLFGGPQEAPLSIFPECSRLCCSALLGSLCEHALVLFLKQRPIWEESLTRTLSLRISCSGHWGGGWRQGGPWPGRGCGADSYIEFCLK